jgi:Rps23 Pro-64 3,4-dihydroxylase Tpa1-like proline 4-hydroxylase
MVLKPYDRDALKREFDSAVPFRHLLIEELLEPDFAAEVAAAYPTFEVARKQGFEFDAVNERRKIQISDAEKFPAPVARLNAALASPQFLADLEYITGIQGLEADPTLGGAGMHVTGPHGRLDVHVDFNYVNERDRHRRLNILVYLNPGWNPAWGGAIELWDRKVKRCHRTVTPALNRCVLFETSEISFHGVTPLVGPPDVVRKSFAAYYYTKEAPPGWDGVKHSTIFRARPDERFRRYVLMPAERLKHEGRAALRKLKRSLIGSRS